MTTVATDNKALLEAIATLNAKVGSITTMMTVQGNQQNEMRRTLDSILSLINDSKKTTRSRSTTATASGAAKAPKPPTSPKAYFLKTYTESESVRAKFAKHIATIHANSKYVDQKAKGDESKTLIMEATLVFDELVGKLSDYAEDKKANAEAFKAFRASQLAAAGASTASTTTSLAAAAVQGTPAVEAPAKTSAKAPAKTPAKGKGKGKAAAKPANATLTDDLDDDDKVDDDDDGSM